MTSLQLIAIGLGAVGAGAILMIVVALTRETSGDRVQARLGQFGTKQIQTLESIELQQPFFERSLRPLVRRFSRGAGRLSSASFASRTASRLATAGSPGFLTVPDWIALKVIVAGGLGFGILLLLLLIRAPFTTALLMGLLFTGIGYIAPEFWLGSRIRQRKRQIVRMLPDSLDLLTISVRAGLGFDAALQRVVENVPGPLTEELRRALAEIRVGKQRREALRAIIPRTDVRALTNFIGAILQAEQLGVPIARVLQVQSEQLRIERRQRAETSAAKAPVKMLLPLVGCILPSLFVVILGPALILISQGLPG
jgi:tight adherence protein C